MTSMQVNIGGKSGRLDKQLGKGGEGDVYALVGQGDCAVKIYKSELRGSRENKV
jgi:DNA-binding helix-hairpin-helix protein with protein kinase domain